MWQRFLQNFIFGVDAVVHQGRRCCSLPGLPPVRHLFRNHRTKRGFKSPDVRFPPFTVRMFTLGSYVLICLSACVRVCQPDMYSSASYFCTISLRSTYVPEIHMQLRWTTMPLQHPYFSDKYRPVRPKPMRWGPLLVPQLQVTGQQNSDTWQCPYLKPPTDAFCQMLQIQATDLQIGAVSKSRPCKHIA